MSTGAATVFCSRLVAQSWIWLVLCIFLCCKPCAAFDEKKCVSCNLLGLRLHQKLLGRHVLDVEDAANDARSLCDQGCKSCKETCLELLVDGRPEEVASHAVLISESEIWTQDKQVAIQYAMCAQTMGLCRAEMYGTYRPTIVGSASALPDSFQNVAVSKDEL